MATFFGVDPVAAVRKFVFRDASADVLPGINVKQFRESIEGDNDVMPITQAEKDRNPYYNQSQVVDLSPARPQPAPAPAPAPQAYAPSAASAPAAPPPLNEAAIRNTQRAIDEIPGLLAAALEAERTRQANALKTFDAQEGQQRKTYDASTVTNQQNYDSNYMDSIRAGIGGLSGLMNILRGTGAAGGTAEDMVRDTVGGVTSNDIRAGADTRNANQTELDTVLSNFLTELKGKRQSARDTFENNQRAVRRDAQTQLQDLYSKMAGYYGDAQRTAEAEAWMNKAGSLTPQIAANSRTKQSAYDTTPVQVAAPQLTAFAGPSQPSTAIAPRDGQVGSGIFTMSRRPRDDREENQVPTALSVGA